MTNRVFKLESYYLDKFNDIYRIISLYDIINQKYAIIMSINILNSNNLFDSSAEEIAGEIIQSEIMESFLRWFDEIDIAIECHFEEFE